LQGAQREAIFIQHLSLGRNTVITSLQLKEGRSETIVRGLIEAIYLTSMEIKDRLLNRVDLALSKREEAKNPYLAVISAVYPNFTN